MAGPHAESPHNGQVLQCCGVFGSRHDGLSLFGQVQQRQVVRGQGQASGWLEDEGTPGAAVDEGQSVQSGQLRRVDTIFAEKLVHQQQAPSIGQGVGKQPGQVLQVPGEVPVGLGAQFQVPRRKLNARCKASAEYSNNVVLPLSARVPIDQLWPQPLKTMLIFFMTRLSAELGWPACV